MITRLGSLPSVVLVCLLSLPLASQADDALGDKLGTVRFETSGTPAARTHVVRGVKLLHHMMYAEADDEFTAATDADPRCALAWWGRAMTIIHPLWPDAPSTAEHKLGAEFVRKGLACVGATPRERAYLETLNVYFGTDPTDYPARLRELDRAWADLSDRYPDDLDALAFSALYHLAPARFLAKDRSHRLQLEAARRLEAVLARIPDHPGAQHYKIHAYDFPLLADRALEVCDTYSGVAPDVPHALHMPTHIFTRRGLWDQSIEFNRRSAEAARKISQSTGALSSHYTHAYDYLAYAYLQTGRYAKAAAIRDELMTLNGPYSPVQRAAMSFAFAATPARCALERQDWTEAAALPLHQPTAFPWSKNELNCDSIVVFARAIGAARSGQLDAARQHIAELDRIHRELAASKKPAYWASQAETQALAARGWVAFAEKKPDEAVTLLRRAVELEANADKEAVTPGEVLPAGDLLGDLLLELNRHGEALAAYEGVLASSPNRLNTLYGAGTAAERAGDLGKAGGYFDALTRVATDADPGIARVEYARRFSRRIPSVTTAIATIDNQTGKSPRGR
jgi:tetratricopeptide (TPR) repeat protein